MKTAYFLLLLALSLMIVVTNTASAQELKSPDKDDLSIDEQREKDIAKSKFIPDPDKLEARWTKLFALPLTEQNDDSLRRLAKDCNAYSNLLSPIRDEYEKYRRENNNYSFIIKKLIPPMDRYNSISNKFKDCRNQAYFNLGEKASISGDKIGAFFYYNDAFRLSLFSCDDGKDQCLRLKAEKKMAEILNIKNVTPYIHWE